MKTLLWIAAGILLASGACKKSDGQLTEDADEVFWLSRAGADMPVWVKGNTASKVFIVVLHGGPGAWSYLFTGVQTEQLRQRYGVVFWDQRNAGSSAGNDNIGRLSLDQMVTDLESLLMVLRHRYGEEVQFFLLGHSFGGLLGTAFLAKGDNQKQVQGWIEVDGAHNYPLTNILSRQMLIDTGLAEIRRNHFVPEWNEIVQYCQNHEANQSYAISYQINRFAHEAEKYVNISNLPYALCTPENPLSILANLYELFYTSSGKAFQETLEVANFSPQLQQIKIPALLLWGQYDFIVPPGVGEDAFANLGSSSKKLIFFNQSGHRPMNTEPLAAQQAIIDFIEGLH